MPAFLKEISGRFRNSCVEIFLKGIKSICILKKVL